MIFRWITEKLIGLLPDIDFPEGILQSLGQAAEWAGFINYYIPVDTFVNCLVVYFGFSVGMWALSAILQLL